MSGTPKIPSGSVADLLASAPLAPLVPLAATSLTVQPPQFAGLHLSGPNAQKTSLVVLEGEALQRPLKIRKVYEKIGSFGTLFSDERLVEILTYAGPFKEVFIDCPLTVPPCVACQRPRCPGAVQCDDVSVAYMLAISSKVRRRGARKARPVNPQSQRLWDVLQLAQGPADRLEPSYSANLAPLVTRARTLQKRLNSLPSPVVLKETQIPNVLESVRHALKLSQAAKVDYRGFETGGERRRQVLTRMIERGWIEAAWDREMFEMVARSVESFHAFISAWVGAMHHAGLSLKAPREYIDSEGWVYLPQVMANLRPKV
jgi:hypothetical protein